MLAIVLAWVGSACSAPAVADAPDAAPATLAIPRWRSLAKLNYARAGHFTFRIGDRLLVIGGGDGGHSPGALPQEIYDPVANTWTPAGDPLAPTRAPVAAVQLADDRVLALAPEDSSATPSIARVARVFDPTFYVWSDVAPPSLCNPGLVRLASGRVLAAGGACSGDALGSPASTVEIYDPVADAWTPAAPMNVRRRAPQLLRLLDDRILAIGGDGSVGGAGAGSLELYAPTLDRWTLLPRSTFGTVIAAAGPLPTGKVLVALLASPAPSGAIDERSPFSLLDPARGTWTRAAWMPTSIAGESLVVDAAGHVVSAGGFDVAGLAAPGARATGVYDEVLDRWTLGDSMPRSSGQTLTLLDSGALVEIGGSYGCGKSCVRYYDTTSVLDTSR